MNSVWSRYKNNLIRFGRNTGLGVKTEDATIITTKPFKVKIFNSVYVDVNLYI